MFVVEYQLITSTRRKSIGLQVKNGKVTVRAPKSISRSIIEQLVISKGDWLKEKIHQQNLIESKQATFVNNSDIWLYGELKQLKVNFGERNQIVVAHDELKVVLKKAGYPDKRSKSLLPSSAINSVSCSTIEPFLQAPPVPRLVKQKLERWLRTEAQSYLNLRLAELSQETGLCPTAMKVRQYKARWGSCDNKGRLSFNYLLMMTPPWVIDYVIVHELCHLKHLNHSQQFWQLVAQHYPLFNKAKRWLAENQHHLQWSL